MINLNDLHLIAQGNTAEVYQYGENRILKLFREGIPFSLCEIEFNNTCLVCEKMSNVPKAYETVNIDNRDGIIFEQISGTDMMKKITSDIFKIKSVSRELADIHIDMHKEQNTNLINVKDKLKSDIEFTDMLSKDNKKIIIDYLETLPDGDTICHLDFHFGNVIIKEDKPIIIDWMTACKGCRCADIARTSVLLKYGEIIHINRIVMELISSVKKIAYRSYINEYKNKTGVTQNEIDKWELPVIAARLSEWLTEHEKRKLLSLVNSKISELKINSD